MVLKSKSPASSSSGRSGHTVTRRDALGLMVGAGAAMVAAVPTTAAADETAEDTGDDEYVANSWRYEDGQPIDDVVLMTRLSPQSLTTAWGKDGDGNWCNSVGDPIPGALLRGIDVSEWQKEVDWSSAQQDGTDYAILRAAAFAGYSSSAKRWGKDYYWDQNATECDSLGIPYGAYIYSYATSVEGAVKEADYILGLLEGHNPTYPVYLDLEDNSILGADLNAIARAFCERVESAGYQAGIYANLHWWNSYLTDTSLSNWTRWVAQYNVTCDYGGRYDMWQATSEGSVDGISGSVDINFDFVGLSSDYANQTTWSRLYGQDQLDTMQRIAETGWSSSSSVVIATQDTFWDTLSASSLAGSLDCPLLLTSSSSLSSQARAALQELGATTAYVVGGPVAVSSSVDSQIRAAGCPTVERVYGQDQQGTARAVAEKLGKNHADTCVIATSWKFQDALSISPYAYARKAPIFLCDSGTNALAEATLQMIRSMGFSRAVIVGGPVAVDSGVEAQLKKSGISSVQRVYGQTEYETSQAIAKWELAQGMVSTNMAVATGVTFYDALTGGALCGRNNSVLVITSDANRVCLTDFVASQKNEVDKGYVLGGPIAVSEASWIILLRSYLY